MCTEYAFKNKKKEKENTILYGLKNGKIYNVLIIKLRHKTSTLLNFKTLHSII